MIRHLYPPYLRKLNLFQPESNSIEKLIRVAKTCRELDRSINARNTWSIKVEKKLEKFLLLSFDRDDRSTASNGGVGKGRGANWPVKRENGKSQRVRVAIGF